jgi:hypothetical protein
MCVCEREREREKELIRNENFMTGVKASPAGTGSASPCAELVRDLHGEEEGTCIARRRIHA